MLSLGLTEIRIHVGGVLAIPQRSWFDTCLTAEGQGCEMKGSEKKVGGKVSPSRRVQRMVT